MHSCPAAFSLLVWCFAVVSAACDAGETPARSKTEPAATADSTSVKLDALNRRIRYLLFAADERDRATRYALPGDALPERCPADAKPENVTPLISVVDARSEPRELLPLELVRRLRGNELEAWKRRHGAVGQSAPRYVSVAPARRAAAELTALLERSYRMVLLVNGYAAPRLILKRGETRRRWVPGVLSGRLVLYEEARGTGWCESKMLVPNDIDEVPISLRQKSGAQRGLTAALGTEARARAWAWLDDQAAPSRKAEQAGREEAR